MWPWERRDSDFARCNSFCFELERARSSIAIYQFGPMDIRGADRRPDFFLGFSAERRVPVGSRQADKVCRESFRRTHEISLMIGRAKISVYSLIAFAGLATALCGCAQLDRLPSVTLSEVKNATIFGIEEARFYPDRDTSKIEALALKVYQRQLNSQGPKATAQILRPAHFLVLSGGGDNGAFGAGLLAGWSARGDRPQFSLVTGISTGALTAPFAFLGQEYDSAMKELYTQTTAGDVFTKRSLLAAVSDDAMTDTTPLRNMIDRYVDKAMIQNIAKEYAKGRLLLVATTNLDQGRPVIWNIGAIAESGHPQARELIVKVLLASAAIPGIFPPVMFDVELGGQRHQEMHVDGGAMAQAFLYPTSLNLKRLSRKTGVTRKRVAYIVRNGRPFTDEESVKRQTLSIAMQAISTMTASSGLNDTYRIYLTARRDGVDFNLAAIGEDFVVPYKEPFNAGYMQSLFEYGYQKGLAGYRWSKTPFGYAE
jgi:predicted acylesterase/phospholipase RssA